jgi:hypothetical protein
VTSDSTAVVTDPEITVTCTNTTCNCSTIKIEVAQAAEKAEGRLAAMCPKVGPRVLGRPAAFSGRARIRPMVRSAESRTRTRGTAQRVSLKKRWC